MAEAEAVAGAPLGRQELGDDGDENEGDKEAADDDNDEDDDEDDEEAVIAALAGSLSPR